jgi:hypothetical protein
MDQEYLKGEASEKNCFLGIPKEIPWKIAENRTLKWGSSPPRTEEKEPWHELPHF